MSYMAELSREKNPVEGGDNEPLFEAENPQEAEVLSVMTPEQQVDYGRNRILRAEAAKSDSIKLAAAESEIRKMAPELADDVFGSKTAAEPPAKRGFLNRIKNLFE
jgi:hypothetical protein